jgi:hypothetical protein
VVRGALLELREEARGAKRQAEQERSDRERNLSLPVASHAVQNLPFPIDRSLKVTRVGLGDEPLASAQTAQVRRF